MLVSREAGLAGELFRVRKPFFETSAKGTPIRVDQDQDGVRNLAGEGLIAVQVLDTVEDFCI